MTTKQEIEALSSGASFYRADLHIHTYGASHDVTDSAMTPQGVIETAIKEKLNLIAITDHNDITGAETASKLPTLPDLTIIPGVELSTPEGHLLVYFETIQSLKTYFGTLSIADKDTHNSRCQNSMLECLNKIDSTKGFAILAHIDGPGGIEEKIQGFPPHKADILSHVSLLGFELKDANSDVYYSPLDNNQQRAKIGIDRKAKLGLGSQQFLARLLFSDSHTVATLGHNAKGDRKVTRIKMDTPTYSGIRIALKDADARIRLEDHIPSSIPYVFGFKIEGGFLNGASAHFSRNLNCIVGGRGAGKSTALEVVRCLAAHTSKNRLIDSEIWPQSLSLIWADEAGQHHTITRSIGEQNTNIDDPEWGPVTFPIECYGQGETAETSTKAQSDPAALLSYLDQFIALDDLKKAEQDVLDELLKNQTEIEKAELKVNQIPQYQRALATTKQQLIAVQKAKATDIVELERKVAEERALRETVTEKINDLIGGNGVSGIKATVEDLLSLADPSTLQVGKENYKTIISLAAGLGGNLTKIEADLTSFTGTFTTSVKAQILDWKNSEKAILDQIEQKRKELAAKGIKLDLAFIRKLANDEATYSKYLTALTTWQKHLTEQKKERIELLNKRRDFRGKIAASREAYAKQASKMLAGSLGDLEVSIKFACDAYSPEAEKLIQETMGWRTVQVQRANILAQELTLPRILDSVKRKDTTQICALKTHEGGNQFNLADAKDILTRLGQPQTLYALERCPIEDRPRITVTKRVEIEPGKSVFTSRDFAKLSLGQQQSVLLALMISSDSKAPLIIDQPEDNLDSEFIYHSLVPALRKAKERRQVIIVTHNANIAVLGDAEQIIALKSLSDKGMIVAQGSIDSPGTRKVACQMLEGSEEAFRRRGQIYGLIS